MAFVYSYTDLQNAVNPKLRNRVAQLGAPIVSSNMAVRNLMSKADLTSAKRRVTIAPAVYRSQNSYPCPADMKDDAIIDLPAQVNRSERFYLTTFEQFDSRKSFDTSMIAFDDRDSMIRRLLVSTAASTKNVMVAGCDTVGTWVASGDAANLTADNFDYVNGSGSLKFDTLGGSNNAVLTNASIPKLDLTPYYGQQLFLYFKIPANATLADITNIQFRWGSSASAYWQATATTTFEQIAFFKGWGVFEFQWPTSSTGTPDITSFTYAQVQVTNSAPNAGTGWHLDFISAQLGTIFDVLYYSKYGWVNNAGAYIEQTTGASTDMLVLDTTDFNLLVDEYAILGMEELGFPMNKITKYAEDSDKRLQNYIMRNPSARKLVETTYHELASLTGDNDITIPGTEGTQGENFNFNLA